MSGSETPLSDLIDAAETSNDNFLELLLAFRHAQLGVIAQGNPTGRAGTVQSTAQNPIAIGVTYEPDGGRVLLAFADPPAFIQKFGQRFNAEMSGAALLQTALADSGCSGIRVNSATREVSVLIDRKTAQKLLSQGAPAAQGKRPWWKFW